MKTISEGLLLGRFLSPDPYIQYPDNLQSYNRYSYVLNNPLSYTDPSGHFAWLAAMVNFILTDVTFKASGTLIADYALAAGISQGSVQYLVLQTAVHAGLNGLVQGIASEAMGGTFA